MLTVSNQFPEFSLNSSEKDDLICKFSARYDEEGNFIHDRGGDVSKGKHMVIFSYPKDFTFICPSELVAFQEVKSKLESEYNCTLLAFSSDSEFCHLGWRKADDRIAALDYPLLADPAHKLSSALGVLDKATGAAIRSTFIVDDKGVVRHSSANADTVGRNPSEIVRILDRLQTNELCAACSLGDEVGEEIDMSVFLNE